MPEHGRWFKGNLHMHSFWSDGHDFPEMVADWFKQAGYDFIAFTEHDRLQTGEKWVACDPDTDEGRSIADGDLLDAYVGRFGKDWVQRRTTNGVTEVRLKPMDEYRHLLEEPDRFLIMTGEEITTRWGSGTLECTHWINALNLVEAIPPPATCASSFEALAGVFDSAKATRSPNEQRILLSLNHPNWHWNATAEDIAAVESLRFMEIHTALGSCRNEGDEMHASVDRIWDIVLTRRLAEMGGPPVYGLATDDCHAYRPDHHLLGSWGLPGRAWVMVGAAELTAESIISAMERGDFYASTGVTLERVEADTRGIALAIQPEPGVNYTTRFIGTRRGYDRSSEPVVDAEGREVRTTRRYSSDVGCVLNEQSGTAPGYRFTGDELYVRAVVISDAPHPNPHRQGGTKSAWTQPVTPGDTHD